MTDEKALEIIRNMEGTDKYTDEALKIAKNYLERQISFAEVHKEAFNGRCPYTNKECAHFNCWRCEINKKKDVLIMR